MANTFEGSIQGLYDSLAEPETWSVSLNRLARSMNSVGCLFLARDEHKAIPQSPTSPDIAESTEVYVREGWYKHDVTAERGWPLLQGRKTVIVDEDICPGEVRLRSPYYQDFRNRWDQPHWAAVAIPSHDAQRCMSVLRNRKQGVFTSEEVKQLALAAPHLGRIAQLASMIGKSQILSSLDTLEKMEQGAGLINWSGKIIALNSTAHGLLDDEFKLRDGRLIATHDASRRRLDAMIDQAILSRFSISPPVVSEVIKVERSNRRPIVVQAMPLVGKLLGAFTPAVAILLLTDLNGTGHPVQRTLRAIWGLSDAESRLAIEVCKGFSLNTIADDLGISKETARKHLMSVFAKVGVHRQSELVAIFRLLPRTGFPA
jgi:DNA-binding CsgD family transcriptional regulator